jgi:CRP/FNR family transcriptional regulator, anaerobic regulatory protein
MAIGIRETSAMVASSRQQTLCTDPEWIGRADCGHCGIRHMMLFSELDDSDFDHLLRPVDNLRYADHCQLYAEGDKGNSVYSIRDGYLKLEQMLPDGSTRIVRLLGRGALVGFEALLGHPYRHTAIALAELDVCRIDTATLNQLEIEKPRLGEKVMAHWERHLEAADRWISEMSSGPVKSRILHLCRYLLELNGREKKAIRFFGYEDMAAMVGTTRETFSRTVAELKREGSTAADGRQPRFSVGPARDGCLNLPEAGRAGTTRRRADPALQGRFAVASEPEPRKGRRASEEALFHCSLDLDDQSIWVMVMVTLPS